VKRLSWVLLSILIAGCTAQPSPIVIYEDKRDYVWLKFDPLAGRGHSHPYEIAAEQMTRILSGVYVQKRDTAAGFNLLFGDKDGAPAFSATQVKLLAPLLATALRKASPRDMAAFYLTAYEKDQGRLITSGGLFVREGRLYFILANAHTTPSSVQYENTYELDLRDEPLLPMARMKFIVGFKPKQAWIPNGELRGHARYDGYEDAAKLVVVDLQKLFAPSSP
jgi:hypothetical protein